MSVKVKINKKEIEPTKKYPCLMKGNTGTIVLFTDKSKGTVMHPGRTKDEIGYYCEFWANDQFESFDGTIELSNEVGE